MKNTYLKILLGCILASISIHAFSQNPYDVVDPFMGDYQGTWIDAPNGTNAAGNPTICAQVINVDDGLYRVKIFHEFDQRCPLYVDTEVPVKNGALSGENGGWVFTVKDKVITGQAQGMGKKGQEVKFSLDHVVRLSPTMGRKPPKDAIVLLGDSGLDALQHGDGKPVRWKWIADEKVMEIDPNSRIEGASRTVVSKEKFKDVRLHVEFRYPIEPGQSGQARGNSGFFLMDFYEVQILNSYGLDGLWNECGSLYKVSAPKVNMAAPPLQWQTYDIIFIAPKFNAAGEKTSNARITIRHNGKLIHNNQEIPYSTANKETGRDAKEPMEAAPIQMQDHNNIIQFRNIWAVHLDQ